MKIYKLSLALLIMGMCTLTSCSDKLELQNPNQPTTGTFGNTIDDLEDAVIACYHHIRMEGTFARVGYTIDMTRGDEVWNASQVWYLPFDNWNDPTTDEINQWSWRDWYYVINICNFVITKCEEHTGTATERYQRAYGQALFIRSLAYYNLAVYYQNPALILSYHDYSTLQGLYAPNKEDGDADEWAQFDRVMDQIEVDLQSAMELLPSRDAGGEWAKGRATKGSAAGLYARVLMQRHKYSDALTVLKNIIGGQYGHYDLVDNYGDNFREGSAYENNIESLFEVQFLDYGTQGSTDEWTPVNVSKDASQGHAIESNCGPGDFGGWADLSAAPWLYHLYKAERTTDGKLDPRLYWTIGTYEDDWANFEYGNMCYGTEMSSTENVVTNTQNGGLPIAKYTNLRTGLYSAVVVGLKCGINIRLIRYSDILLRAAECENEVNGPTQQAIDWINKVRRRAHLEDLQLADFPTKDKLFEQIANVERPKEFGCEYGRGFDLLRWGFFYDNDRMKQMKQHSSYRVTSDKSRAKEAVTYGSSGVQSSFDTFVAGHEFLPINQGTLEVNPNLVGNSANYNKDNSSYFTRNGWSVHPVVDL